MPTSTKKLTPIAGSQVYDPDGDDVVRLGQREYVIREVPLGRVKKFKGVWLDFFQRTNGMLDSADLTQDDAATALFGLIEDAPSKLMEILIPDLDVDAFNDEDDGATIPQVFDAIDVVLRVNKLEFLKRAVPFVIETLRIATMKRVLTGLPTAATEPASEKTT